MGMGRGSGNRSTGRPRKKAARKPPADSESVYRIGNTSNESRIGDPDAKRRGELVELMFMVKASQQGLAVAKPYGDSRRYDFILEANRLLWRVQVKSSANRRGYGYCVNATARRHSREVYTAEEIDFLIAYVIPRSVWYVIPATALRTSTFLVFPDGSCRRGGRYEQYREAWRLLGGSSQAGK
jgi:hypothetical protein